MISASETLMLVNPESHGGILKKEWPAIEREVRRALGEAELRVMFTTSVDHGAGIVRAALREGVKQIVAVGGDGTFAEVVQGFFQGGEAIAPDAEMMLVPGGRGNDFFRMVSAREGGQEGWMRGVALIQSEKAAPCDLIQVRLKSRDGGVTSRLGLNLSSFGFGGHVVSRVHQKEGVIGRSFLSKTSLSYLLHSAATFLEYDSVLLRVSVDGALLYEGKLMMGAVLNGAFNAGGLCWSRQARIDDGLLDIVLLPPLAGLNRVRLLQALAGGDVASIPGAISAQGRQVEIVDLDPTLHRYKLFEVDGDLPEPPGLVRAEFKVLPGAVRIRR
jgi:diacylglycerol kinase (ATP)